jgi:hypothetical protein
MIHFKPEVVPSDICKISPFLRILISEVEAYFIENQLGRVLITSLMSDHVGDRISKTHADGRGCDISIKEIDELHQERLKFYLNSVHGKSWGTRPIDKPNIPTRVAVIHGEGDNKHLHLQVRKNINLNIH